MEVDSHLNAVGNPDEGNAGVHAEFLTVECHGPFNVARPCTLAGNRKGEGLGLRDAANGKRAWHIKGGGASLHNLVRVKRDQRILLDVEEMLAPELVVFHATSGVNSGSMNLDVHDAGCNVGRRKCQ